jgi:hypothetical protein
VFTERANKKQDNEKRIAINNRKKENEKSGRAAECLQVLHVVRISEGAAHRNNTHHL